MVAINYNYDSSNTELYRTNNYTSGTDADIDNTAPVDDTDGYTSNIDVTSKQYATIDFKFLEIAAGSTDDLVLKLFRSLTSTHDVDEIAIDEIIITNDGTEDIFSYVIGMSHGPGHYRFSMQSSGATDKFDIHVEMRQTDFVSA